MRICLHNNKIKHINKDIGICRMSTQKFDPDRANRFTRKSWRLQTHNYAWTATYHVILRAKEHAPLFETPQLRKILQEEWEALPQRFPNLTLNEFMIMPDHLHLLLSLEGNVERPVSLASVIGAYKSLVFRQWYNYIQAEKLECAERFWQQRYYDRIIRDGQDFERTRQYIRDNPTKSSPDTHE